MLRGAKGTELNDQALPRQTLANCTGWHFSFAFALHHSPGRQGWLAFHLLERGNRGSEMLSDFSEVVQTMNDRARTGIHISQAHALTLSCVMALPCPSPASAQFDPGLFLPTTTQMESGRANWPSHPTLLSAHWKLLPWAQIYQNRGKKKKGHSSQPFARISELKMEDLSFAWWREAGERTHC